MGVNYVQLIDGGVEFNYVHKDFLPADLSKYPPPKDFKTNSGSLAFESSILMRATETSSQQQIEWDVYYKNPNKAPLFPIWVIYK